MGLLVQFYGFSPIFSLIYFLIVVSGGVHVSLVASGSVFWILSAFYSGHILSPFARSLGVPLAPGDLWLLFGFVQDARTILYMSYFACSCEHMVGVVGI